MSKAVNRQSRRFYARGMTSCVHCGEPTYLYELGLVDDLVPLLCEHCGKRSVREKAQLTVELLPDRRRPQLSGDPLGIVSPDTPATR